MKQTNRKADWLLVHGWELWGPFMVGGIIVGWACLRVWLGAR